MSFGLFPFGTDAFGATSGATPGVVINASLPAITAVITAEARGVNAAASFPALTAAVAATKAKYADAVATLPPFTAVATTTNAYPPPEDYPLGKREFTADFAKGHLTANLSITKRPDAVTFDYLVGFSLGPIALGDVSLGIISHSWYARADNANKVVWMARRNDANNAWLPETILFHFSGEDIEEVDFAFEQAGRPVVCAERLVAGVREVWLYWFDPFLGAFTFVKFDNGRTPRVVLDNPPDTSNSDVQFFYLKTAVGLVVRTQHEAYATAHATPHIEETDWYLEDIFYTNNWRVAGVLVQHTAAGKYNKKRLESALMPVFLGPKDNNMTFSGDILSILDRVTLFFVAPLSEDYQFPLGMTSIDDGPILLFHTLFDKDPMQFPMTVLSADDHIAQLFATTYDIDNFKYPMSLTSADDTVVVILHTLFDKDAMKFPMTLTSIDDS